MLAKNIHTTDRAECVSVFVINIVMIKSLSGRQIRADVLSGLKFGFFEDNKLKETNTSCQGVATKVGHLSKIFIKI